MIRTASGKLIPYRKPRQRFTYAGDRPMALHCARWYMATRNGHCQIEHRDFPGLISLARVIRRVQLAAMWTIALCAIQGIAIDVLWLKNRRVGLSTIAEWWNVFLVRVMPRRNAITAAQSDDATEKIFKLANTMEDASGRERSINAATWKIVNPSIKSTYSCVTGVGQYTGSGDTVHSLHVAELSKWPQAKVRAAVNSLGNSMAQSSPFTCRIRESTGNGDDIEFAPACKAAFKNPDGPVKFLFVRWLDDDGLTEPPHRVPEMFEPALAGYEIELVEKHGATPGQIQWRRNKMDKDFPGVPYSENPVELGYDFPTTVEEALGKKGGLLFGMMSKTRHEGTIDFKDCSEQAYRYRTIDWGSTQKNPFVCFRGIIDPSQPPQIVIAPNPKLQPLWDEFAKYCRDEVTDKPIDQWNHCIDALRILIVTERVEGLLYVEDLVYIDKFDAKLTEGDIAREVHRMSGWIPPAGDTRASPETWTIGPNGVNFKVTVADRARPGLIRDYTAWGIRCTAHTKPDEKDTRFGEIEDGLFKFRVLAQGDANFKAVFRDEYAETLRRAREKLFPTDGSRPRFLTDKEKAAWQRHLAEQETHENGGARYGEVAAAGDYAGSIGLYGSAA